LILRESIPRTSPNLHSTLQKLAVGKILCILRSGRDTTHGQTTTMIAAIFSKKIDRWKSWQSDCPWWQSDHARIESGGLTGPWWWSNCQGLPQPPETTSSTKVSPRNFNDSIHYESRRRMVVLTRNSHKNKELKHSGNYRLIK
jgi:hypothetical protein